MVCTVLIEIKSKYKHIYNSNVITFVFHKNALIVPATRVKQLEQECLLFSNIINHSGFTTLIFWGKKEHFFVDLYK